MKKILLLLCLLLCACSAQTDIKDYTIIYKNILFIELCRLHMLDSLLY